MDLFIKIVTVCFLIFVSLVVYACLVASSKDNYKDQ